MIRSLKNIALLGIILFSYFNFNTQSKILNFNIFKSKDDTSINNFCKPKPSYIENPKDIKQIQYLVKKALKNSQKISICGAGQSQGGQTCDYNAIMLDLSNFNKIKNLDIQNKLITVESGIKWIDIIKHINKHNLSVKAMQSYSDFSVGGSIGVNAHGQNIHSCDLSKTIKRIKLINYQGKIIELNETKNKELFSLVIGGYGLFGVIAEVTLELIDNQNLNKRTSLIKTCDYCDYFNKNIKNNQNIAFHSARLSISPKNLFKETLVIDYHINNNLNLNTNIDSQSKISNIKERAALNILRKYNVAKNKRFKIEQKTTEKNQDNITRNQFLSSSINSLKLFNNKTVDILQEYFIPMDKLSQFISELRYIVKVYKVNLINASIRYVSKQTIPYIKYSPQESFAIVLYINLPNNNMSYNYAKLWTKELIKSAIQIKGRFYLPYQHFASNSLLNLSYPEFDNFLKLKQIYDPKELFVSEFYNKYK